jgi:hypothetical protein
MEPEGSLPCSQEHVTGPYKKPDDSDLHLPSYFVKNFFFILSLQLYLDLFPSGFPTNILQHHNDTHNVVSSKWSEHRCSHEPLLLQPYDYYFYSQLLMDLSLC